VGENEVPLPFKELALSQPILRKCTKAKGVSDEPMPRSAFTDIFGTTLKNVGYFCATSIHAIRRQLGKKVDERYTEVQSCSTLRKATPAYSGSTMLPIPHPSMVRPPFSAKVPTMVIAVTDHKQR
jgi:hypothetical protein